jgi:ubiquinone/menaquinone biosynthesis C-methylase UbiE
MMTLKVQSRDYWRGRQHAEYRNAGEEWLKRYADELLALVPNGGTLLDIGCGACEYTPYLATRFDHIVAVDFSESMLSAARERLSKFQLRNVTLLQGDASGLPEQVEHANVIIANGLLQYLDDDALTQHLQECKRVLTQDGTLFWGLVPNAHRRQLWYAGALDSPPPSTAQMLSRWWHSYRYRSVAEKSGDSLWDGVGRWFEPEKLRARVENEGFTWEVRHSWFYEYRFHAVLRRQ